MLKKTSLVIDHLIDHDLDILALTETWHYADDTKTIGDMSIAGYNFHHVPRGSRGGGVAILIRSSLPAKVNSIFEARSFESIHVTIQAKSICLQVVTIYRVPPSTKNKIKSWEFLPEFTEYLEQLAPLKGKLLIAGDINIKWNLLHDPERKSFADILDTNNLIQHVSALIPTHDKGNTIDMIISR